jgi:hypothetical protein
MENGNFGRNIDTTTIVIHARLLIVTHAPLLVPVFYNTYVYEYLQLLECSYKRTSIEGMHLVCY